MKEKKLNDIEVKEIIENEGMGYAVQHYMNSDSIKNEETKKLWDAVRDAMNALAEHLSIDE